MKGACAGVALLAACLCSYVPSVAGLGNMFTDAPTAAPTMTPPSGPGDNDVPAVQPPVTMGMVPPGPMEACTQLVAPPGVKPGACMQIVCLPDSIQAGDVFRATVRFCLQRPRMWHLEFDLLDEPTKAFYSGIGYGIRETPAQCAEITLETEFKAEFSPGTLTYDLMWKFFALPVWGQGANAVKDTFPNMIAETGVDVQPLYTAPLKPEGNCPVVPDRMWNLPPTGKQNAIEYVVPQPCFTRGKPWTIQVKTHLETRPTADLHCNLQLGTGGDVFLGPLDVYVTEAAVPALLANPVATDWNKLPANYYTTNDVTFSAIETAKVAPTDKNLYVACFMSPLNSQFDPAIPNGGWVFLEREFFLEVAMCPVA